MIEQSELVRGGRRFFDHRREDVVSHLKSERLADHLRLVRHHCVAAEH